MATPKTEFGRAQPSQSRPALTLSAGHRRDGNKEKEEDLNGSATIRRSLTTTIRSKLTGEKSPTPSPSTSPSPSRNQPSLLSVFNPPPPATTSSSPSKLNLSAPLSKDTSLSSLFPPSSSPSSPISPSRRPNFSDLRTASEPGFKRLTISPQQSRKIIRNDSSVLELDVEKEELKQIKLNLNEEVTQLIMQSRIEWLTNPVVFRIFSKSKLAGFRALIRLDNSHKYLEIYESKGAGGVGIDEFTDKARLVDITSIGMIELNISPTTDPSLAAAMSKNRDIFDTNLIISIIFKNSEHHPTMLWLSSSRHEFSGWADGLGCLVGANMSQNMLNDIDVLSEAMGLGILYPAPPPPNPPSEELLQELQIKGKSTTQKQGDVN
eukprot:TRINITY_DN4822_c0_g1_i1.p1 TRINITY_DN4822_c0_g1~~TRINITY_DN4822_c0_g1_i1.p1  ORF type:complete len:378 (+),score=82.01 TRINITY_DN4822_c0_g1_i1:66-1199(+)